MICAINTIKAQIITKNIKMLQCFVFLSQGLTSVIFKVVEPWEACNEMFKVQNLKIS